MLVPVEWKSADDGDENTLEGYASTFGNVDLQYDVVAKGAFKSTLNRVRNGEVPFLADHRASVRDVLGTLIDAVEDSKGLKIKVRFSDDADTQTIRQKMLGKHLRTMSIGYEPLQWRYETRGDERVRVLEDVRLWEVSAVVFPANPQAVIQRAKSAVRETVDQVVAGAVANGGDEREIKAALSDWLTPDTQPTTSPDEPPNQHDKGQHDTGEGDGPEGAGEVKGAIGSHKTATSTGAWDGPANVARVPDDASAATLRAMFAWVDSTGDATSKSSYKFPHHDVGSDGSVGAANVRGCQAAIAVLNGGRGGANIPSGDRRGVYNHLARHLRDAGVDVPELASADSAHLETGDAPATGAEPGSGDGPDSLTLAMRRADAVLAGRDPDEVADPVKLAGLSARLDLLDEWVQGHGVDTTAGTHHQ